MEDGAQIWTSSEPARWLYEGDGSGVLGFGGLVGALVPANYPCHVWVSLESVSLAKLAGGLAAWTERPDESWYACWTGADAFVDWDGEPTFRINELTCLLFRAPVADAPVRVSDAFERRAHRNRLSSLQRPGAHARSITPTFWWPTDRQWTCGSHPDTDGLFVGGSAGLIDALHSDFGAQTVDPEDRLPLVYE